MKTQLLSGARKRGLSLALLCCLWIFAAPAKVEAADPAFANAACVVQSVNMGMGTTWQIKGTASVINLPGGMTAATVTVKFQKKANGATDWSDMFSVNQTAPAMNGTAGIDTGFQTFTPAPAQGDQYRILCSGTWLSLGPPQQSGTLTPVGSVPITPVP